MQIGIPPPLTGDPRADPSRRPKERHQPDKRGDLTAARMGAIRSPRLHRLDIRTLADLASGLAWAGADPDDVVLVLPEGNGALVLGSESELIDAGRAFQGAICLA